MERRKLTAEELEKLTPLEQDQLFSDAVVSDLDDIPPEFLARVRARLEGRIESAEAVDPR